MADHLSPQRRSKLMGTIRGKNTKPELSVRKLLHTMGYRFRLHKKDLPGRPDVVLKKYGTVIFINGCFWHGHNCGRGKLPNTNVDFWKRKISGNVRRDARNQRRLRGIGWSVQNIWTCQIERDIERIIRRLALMRLGEKNTVASQKPNKTQKS